MRVNGKDVFIKEGITLDEYLCENGFLKGRIAVEKNGDIVPKAMYAKTVLKDSDRLEIVRFVGGG